MRRSAPALAAIALAACTSAPVQPLPDPLPEILEWARPAAQQGEAFLGLEVRENDSGSLEALSFDPGVRVTRVVEGSPAAQAGLTVGDVLLALGEARVDDPGTLSALLRGARPGAELELEVRRGDSVFRVPVRLRPPAGEAPGEALLVWRSDPARSRAGWLAGRGGVVLVTSHPDGPFPRAGIEVGSVVTALDGEPVHSERALIRNLQAREPGARVRVDFRAPPDRDAQAGAGAGPGPGAEQTAAVHLLVPRERVIEATLPVLIGYTSSVDGETAGFYLLDLWLISLFRYRREGNERHYRILRFITFSTGVGELSD